MIKELAPETHFVMEHHDLSCRTYALKTMKLLVLGLLFFSAPAACQERAAPPGDAPKADSSSRGCALTESLDGAQRYVESLVGTNFIGAGLEKALGCLESVFGPDNVHNVAMFVEMALRFVAEGAASGLNVIAVYVSEILRATGADDHFSIPHFTPEGVTFVAKWALLALAGYWLLCLALRVSIALLRQVFWLVKRVAVVWLFVRIITSPTEPDSPETTAVRVAMLVVFCAVLTVATGAVANNSPGLENRLNNLEGRVKVMEKNKEE